MAVSLLPYEDHMAGDSAVVSTRQDCREALNYPGVAFRGHL
jgi:hypothetical protein